MLRGKLLASEQEQCEVAGGRGKIEVAGELERDREAALHVARPEAVDRTVLDVARKVGLRRDRVVVADEDDEREASSAR